MFKKENLKNGMIVEYKDGKKSIRINNKLYYLTTKAFDNISEFNEDLYYIEFHIPEKSIIEDINLN